MATVGKILTERVRVLLRDIDEGGIQWRDAELIQWFNEACGEIARLRPEAASKTIELSPLASGSKQSIPAGHTLLLEAVCNATAGVEGRAVRRVERSTLDNEDPDWMKSVKTEVVFRYAASLTDPRSFYVYPPSTGQAPTGLSIVTSTTPAEVTALADNCPLPAIYEAVVANYILFRAYAKLSESPTSQQTSAGYLQLFNLQVGDTTKIQEGRNAVMRDDNPENRVLVGG